MIGWKNKRAVGLLLHSGVKEARLLYDEEFGKDYRLLM